MISTFAEFFVQAQTHPSSEVLTALDNLIAQISKIGRSSGNDQSWLTPDGLKAVAAFVSAVAWPALALFFVLRFRSEIVSFLTRIRKMEAFGVKAEIEAELEKSAQDAEASQGQSKAPTRDELKRAEYVERLATPADFEIVRRQVDDLAAEYEKIRATMPSSDARTRRMEVIVSKMRTIGRAAYPLRYRLMQSPSPGQRLQAVACLQVIPDFDQLDWLADRVRVEKPFVSYHAIVALNVAAQDSNGSEHLTALTEALENVRAHTRGLSSDADRVQELAAFEARVSALRSRK
jgi:hypothetical protein